MSRLLKTLALLFLLSVAAHQAEAFTLLGPSTTWQTISLGYGATAPNPGVGLGTSALGGPMNLGEDYRWNVPTIYYGFSPSFQVYFGERGMQEIEKAIAILNALPSMDSVNLDDFPLSAQRVNFQGQALSLVDVKSYVLSFLVETLGITDPTRFVFTLRQRYLPPLGTNYVVIKRNFDPITWQPSSFINGQLWTYTSIIDNQNAPVTLTVNETVDPLASQGLINAPVSSGLVTGKLLTGGFWTGLTRDDVGGFQYIYRHNNYNIEVAPPGATKAGLGVVTSGGSTSPWTIPIVNPVGTTTGGGTVVTAATNIVGTALRPGLGRVPKFVRLDFDSQIGFFTTNSFGFTDQYITNGAAVSQDLVRTLTIPDILFDAGDLQGSDTAIATYTPSLNTQQPWVTNGVTDFGTGKFGPGVIPPSAAIPSFTLTLNSVGPIFFGSYPFPESEITSFQSSSWASFDGSTNAPVIYPVGSTIQQVESSVLGGSTSNGGGSGSAVSTWTPVDQVLFPPGTTVGGTTTGTTTGTGTGAASVSP